MKTGRTLQREGLHVAVQLLSFSGSEKPPGLNKPSLSQRSVNLQKASLHAAIFLSGVTMASLSLSSSIRSEDSKEVFLAIQVDGVTRARTAPLALRGPALSLNHAFHLELERAQLLRVILLTPGDPRSPFCLVS